jgi:hypothetical protein
MEAREPFPRINESVPAASEHLGTGVRVEVMGSDPEQLAVPLDSMARVGGEVAPAPPSEMLKRVEAAIVFAPVNVTVAVAPLEPLLKMLTLQFCPAEPTVKFAKTDAIVAVPEQVAVPFDKVAVVGDMVAPSPPAVMASAAPPAIVFVPVKATVAVAPVKPLLKPLRLQVWPVDPAMDPPET